MQPIFITGSTGFLGAHLVCALLQKGYKISALKRPEASLKEFTFIAGLYFGHVEDLVVKNLVWVDGDITDYDSFEMHIQKDQLVFHCAALVSFDASDTDRLFCVNVNGTENIVNACLLKGVKKLIYCSSTAAVGKLEGGSLTYETQEWDEKDLPSNYSRSKYYAELEVWRGIEEGLNAVIVNPAIIFGPCDWNKASGRFFMNANNNLPFYTNGSNGFVYVKDVARAMILLSDRNITNERFLLVGQNMSFRNFMNCISDTLGKKRPSVKVSPFFLGIIWRFAKFINLFSGVKSMLTRESAASSIKNISYSNQKIKDAIQFEFTEINTAIDETVRSFNKDL